MSKRRTPNQLLNGMRKLLAEMRDEGENGITRADRVYEDADKLLTALDEACKAGDLPEWRTREASARKILVDGLTYHEHDGHNMPKRVAREALAALGVPQEQQPF